jgi:hypothetical protein
VKTAIERSRTNYNGKLEGKALEENELVWLFTPRIKPGVGKKLTSYGSGPWKIEKIVSNVLFRIQTQGNWNRRSLNIIASIDRLKRFKGEIGVRIQRDDLNEEDVIIADEFLEQTEEHMEDLPQYHRIHNTIVVQQPEDTEEMEDLLIIPPVTPSKPTSSTTPPVTPMPPIATPQATPPPSPALSRQSSENETHMVSPAIQPENVDMNSPTEPVADMDSDTDTYQSMEEINVEEIDVETEIEEEMPEREMREPSAPREEPEYDVPQLVVKLPPEDVDNIEEIRPKSLQEIFQKSRIKLKVTIEKEVDGRKREKNPNPNQRTKTRNGKINLIRRINKGDKINRDEIWKE